MLLFADYKCLDSAGLLGVCGRETCIVRGSVQHCHFDPEGTDVFAGFIVFLMLQTIFIPLSISCIFRCMGGAITAAVFASIYALIWIGHIVAVHIVPVCMPYKSTQIGFHGCIVNGTYTTPYCTNCVWIGFGINLAVIVGIGLVVVVARESYYCYVDKRVELEIENEMQSQK
jgi:hypothetical protein